MSPMKVVTLAKVFQSTLLNSAPCVEKTIENVDGPSAATDEQQNPTFQVNTRGARQRQRPDDCDSGCIQTGEMPEFQNLCESKCLREGLGIAFWGELGNQGGRHYSDSRAAICSGGWMDLMPSVTR